MPGRLARTRPARPPRVDGDAGGLLEAGPKIAYAPGSLGGGLRMTLGVSLSALTTLHVVISLIGIASGLVVLYGMLTSQRLGGWTALFLATTILTSITGFMFPFNGLLPSHVVGAISLVLLAVALLALYAFRLSGAWRWVYVATALAALYLNVFVAVVQAFRKLAFLQPLAPTQSEPPFAVAQLVVLAIFLALGFLAVRRFDPVGGPAA
jgi:hypothetical protein